MPRHPALVAGGLLLATAAPAQIADWHRLPVLTSSATKGLAFDAARERMVQFESSGWGQVSRTWEWVDAAWSLRRTATTPPPREDFAFAYDPVRRRLVMFGGISSSHWATPLAVLDDTWEYDGIDWLQRFPTLSPPPQTFAWMGFDHANGQLMLCGGWAANPGAGEWLYDGTTWTSVAAPSMTSADRTAYASDPIRQRIVALTVGYYRPLPYFTLEWDGNTWSQMQPAQQPPARLDRRMTFVGSRGTVVLHGGYPLAPGSPATDLWEWNGVNWSPIATAPAPVRTRHAMAHDPVRDRTLVVGGSGVGTVGTDTLQWDGTNWHSTLDSIGRELLGNAAFDGNRQRVVAVTDSPLHTVEWDGERWQTSAPPPGLLYSGGIAYDAYRARLVVVGFGSQYYQTWEHDGSAWSPPIQTPSAAYGSLVYHAGRGRVMHCSSSALQEWNGASWIPVAPGPGSMVFGPAYDAARNEIVVAIAYTSAGTLLTSTWNGTNWTQHQPVSSPAPRTSCAYQALGYDEVRQRVVLFGGRDPGICGNPAFQFQNDLWEWDGANWIQRILASAPEPREAAALVFDPARQQLLLLGGNRQEAHGGTLMFSDVWALDSAAAATVMTLGPGCGGANTPVLVTSAPHPGAPAFTIDVHSQQASAPALFLFALGNASAPLGPGCTSFVPNPDQIAFTLTNGDGFASTRASIPPGLLGFSFSAQAALLDATSPLGFSVTPGLRITVGR